MSRFEEFLLNVFSFLIFSTLSVVVLCSGCEPVAPGDKHSPQKYESQTKKEGQRAAQSGISAEANPYLGTNSEFAKYWLDGYLTEIEKSHDKRSQ